MRYLTGKEMQLLDRITIEKYGIPAVILMENAGRAVAVEVLKTLPHPPKPAVSILCGSGNNGGDGLVAARHLFNRGVKVKVFYLGDIKNSLNKGAARPAGRPLRRSGSEARGSPRLNIGAAGINLNIVLQMKIPLIEAKEMSVSSLIRRIQTSRLIVDAIFGIGLARPVEGKLKDLISAVNQSGKPVISVDVPSGLDCDRGVPLGVAIKANKTVTLGAPKIGFKKASAKKYLGKLVVADIGIPSFLFKAY